MLVVVATPITWWWAFLGYAGLLALVVIWSRVPLGYLAKRMVIEVPFVIFAVLMPVVAQGPRVDWFGMSLSQAGLHSAASLLTKGTLGVLASLTLAATTEAVDLLSGLSRLRVPALLVAIMSFMVRYLDVVSAEAARMLVAMRSRGVDPRSVRQWPVVARALAVLFIRAYERGERVHLAMLSRGYDGRLVR